MNDKRARKGKIVTFHYKKDKYDKIIPRFQYYNYKNVPDWDDIVE